MAGARERSLKSRSTASKQLRVQCLELCVQRAVVSRYGDWLRVELWGHANLHICAKQSEEIRAGYCRRFRHFQSTSSTSRRNHRDTCWVVGALGWCSHSRIVCTGDLRLGVDRRLLYTFLVLKSLKASHVSENGKQRVDHFNCVTVPAAAGRCRPSLLASLAAPEVGCPGATL
jgi:hypothetical protein